MPYLLYVLKVVDMYSINMICLILSTQTIQVKGVDMTDTKRDELKALLMQLRLEIDNLETKIYRVKDKISDVNDLILDIQYGEVEYV